MNEKTAPVSWTSDPTGVLLSRCAAMAAGLPANPLLSAEVCWSVQERGDWLAGVVSPGFVRVFLLPGGGELWGDIPLGQQRYLALGDMDWRFLAASDPVLGNYQYVELAPACSDLRSMAAARLLANDARQALGLAAQLAAPDEEPPGLVSRRGFLRALSGRH